MKRQRKCMHSLRKSHFRRNKLIRGKTGGHCAKYTVVRKGDANSCALMKNEVEVKMSRSICAVYWRLKKEWWIKKNRGMYASGTWIGTRYRKAGTQVPWCEYAPLEEESFQETIERMKSRKWKYKSSFFFSIKNWGTLRVLVDQTSN